MQIRSLTKRKEPDSRPQYRNVRLIMGALGFILGVYITIKIIVWVYG